MSLNRRQFLRLLASGVAGTIASQELDWDRLLWVPGEKRIFLPSKTISLSEIVAAEIARITPHIRTLFERDDMFYRILKNTEEMSFTKEIQVPLDWKK